MKAYRISWVSFIENNEALEGRSLVYADSEQEAVYKLQKEKSVLFNVQMHQVEIVSVIQLTYLDKSSK